MSKIRIASYLEKSWANGPCKNGKRRFTIWVQGCSLKCRGCSNKHMWSKDGGTEIEVKKLAEKVNSVKDEICGVTLTGGEPLEQSQPIKEFLESIDRDLTVMMFTGYTMDEINRDERKKKAVELVDLLICGRYVEELSEGADNWRGSINQELIYISNRIEREKVSSRKIEIRIAKDGTLDLTGFPTNKFIKSLEE